MSNESLKVTSSTDSTSNAQLDTMYKVASLNNPILNEKLKNSQNSAQDIFTYLYETYGGGVGEKEYTCLIAGFDVYDPESTIQPEDVISNAINKLREGIKAQEL